MTRPTFVLTDHDVGLPGWSEEDVVHQIRALPIPATVYTLAKLAQWRAAEPVRPIVDELQTLSAFMTQRTFERARAVLARGEHQVVFRYASILAAIRLLIAKGTPAMDLDPADADVEHLGDVLLAINRLVGGMPERPLLVLPDTAQRMWLGEMAVMAREHGGVPMLGWLVGASIFRRVASTVEHSVLDSLLRRARRPGLAAMFSGLAIWLGHSATGELKPHLYKLGELDRENRGAAWLARRLACRRKDGPALVPGWCSSPAASRLRDMPFFVHRGTAVCADPLALGDVAALRFGGFVGRVSADVAKDRAEERALKRWTVHWTKTGLEGFVRDELLSLADAGDQPVSDQGQQCDVVARFGRAVLFVEVKLTYPSPSTLRLRDRELVHVDLLKRFARPGVDGLPQVLATMNRAATMPSSLPRSAPTASDTWWAIVVTAEPIPCSREWRVEWRRAAEQLPRPGVQPFHGPVFLTVADLCWFIDLARSGWSVGVALDAFMNSAAMSMSNFASTALKRGMPAWLAGQVEDHIRWLGEQAGD
ncbi:MAG: hypothetical protein ABIO70_11755 [Pseudomonadota bacterium]